MDVKATILLFDQHLSEEGLHFDAIVIGGAALNVMEVIQRETIDVDCLSPKIPDAIIASADRFRIQNPDLLLSKEWLNNGPETLIRELDADWHSRVVEIYVGKAITLKTLGRIDLLKTKLFAYCDRETDLQDCIALRPTIEELADCLQWVKERDAHPKWPENVEVHFQKLIRKLRGA